MSRAVLKPADAPRLISTMDEAIKAVPARGDHDDYAPPDVRRETQRLIDRDHMALDAEERRMERLAVEINRTPLDRLFDEILALVFGDMIELAEGIMKEVGDKQQINADDLAKALHRLATKRNGGKP